jgi:hypothetical protein
LEAFRTLDAQIFWIMVEFGIYNVEQPITVEVGVINARDLSFIQKIDKCIKQGNNIIPAAGFF